MHTYSTLAAGLSLLSVAAAQTSTDCNPTETTCGSDEGINQSYLTTDFTQGESSDWNVTYGSVTYDDTNGATYTISESGDAPTMQTNGYLFFGVVSVVARAAPGTGIITAAILESDDLDEIDWEWFGSKSTQVETNYFGKGNTSTYDRETYIDMDENQDTFHNYTVVWTKESLTWYVDGESKRVLNYEDSNGGSNYPQTPMRVKLGTWAGGDSSNSEGTIEWAGGDTDYSQGPFVAYVKSVSITNYNPAESYTYTDTSGSYDSIELSDDESDSSSSSTRTTSSTQTSSGASASASSSSSSTTVTASSATGSVASNLNGTSGSGTTSTNSTASAEGGSSNSTTSSSGSSSTSDSASSSGTASSSSSSSSSTSAVTTSDAAFGRPSALSTSVLLAAVGWALLLI